VATIEESVNERDHRTIRIKQHDGLAALTLLAKISGMLVNKTELSGPQAGPVEVVDYRQQITDRLEAMSKRMQREQPIIDVTASPSALLAARLRDKGERE
jgi:hypothetical protein